MAGTSGKVTTDQTLKRKVMNDAVARITNLAQLRGRNAEWAVWAVRDAANITAHQALALRVIDLIEPNLHQLLNEVDGRALRLQVGPSNRRRHGQCECRKRGYGSDRTVSADAGQPHPCLFAGQFRADRAFLELSHPGIGIPGIFGATALILGLLGLGGLPVVWAGLGLILVAFVLFVVDLFVPSAGF